MLDGPPFPELIDLSMKKVDPQFDTDTLDDLIQRRCFPMGHPGSRMDPSIANALEQFVITADIEPMDWKRSRYLAKYFVKVKGKIHRYRFVAGPGHLILGDANPRTVMSPE